MADQPLYASCNCGRTIIAVDDVREPRCGVCGGSNRIVASDPWYIGLDATAVILILGAASTIVWAVGKALHLF